MATPKIPVLYFFKRIITNEVHNVTNVPGPLYIEINKTNTYKTI